MTWRRPKRLRFGERVMWGFTRGVWWCFAAAAGVAYVMYR